MVSPVTLAKLRHWRALHNARRALDRFETSGSSDALDNAIAAIRVLLGTKPHLRRRYAYINQLALYLSERFTRTSALPDLEKAIRLNAHVLRHAGTIYCDRADILHDFGSDLLERFRVTGERSDLSAALDAGVEAVALTSPGDDALPMRLNNLASLLAERFEITGDRADLFTAAKRIQEALAATPPGHRDRAAYLNNLANRLITQFELTGEPGQLDAAIEAIKEALRLTPAGHPKRAGRLHNFGGMMWSRYRLTGVRADLDAALSAASNAVALSPIGHSDRPLFLSSMASHLGEFFIITGDQTYLERALTAAAEALRLTPQDHYDRPMFLNNISTYYSDRFDLYGQRSDLDAAVRASEEAVRLGLPDHVDRPLHLSNLGVHLAERFEEEGAYADLLAAMHAAENAVRLTPDGHSERPLRLMNLSLRLMRRYEITGASEDLDAAVEAAQEVVRATPPASSHLPMHLNNLANVIGERFELKGHHDDLEIAIDAGERSVHLSLEGDTGFRSRIYNLSYNLGERFKLLGRREDLDRAIMMAQRSLELLPERHRDEARYLTGIANRLLDRFLEDGEWADVEAAQAAAVRSVECTPEGHQDRPVYLSNLGHILLDRSSMSGEVADVQAAIRHLQDAMDGLHLFLLESEDTARTAREAAKITRTLFSALDLMGDYAALLAALEKGKAIRLRAELIRSNRMPVNLSEAQRMRYAELHQRIKELGGELRNLTALAPADRSSDYARETTKFGRELADLRAERQSLEVNDPAFQESPLDYRAVRALSIESGTAIVYLQPLHPDLGARTNDLVIIVIHPASPEDGPAKQDIIRISGSGRPAIGALLAESRDDAGRITTETPLYRRSAGTPTYGPPHRRSNTEGGQASLRWYREFERTLTKLGPAIMSPVAECLRGIGARRAVLIPGDMLAILPLHAATADDQGNIFCDLFEIRYAPSSTAFARSISHAGRNSPPSRLVGIANPDHSLAFAELEMRSLAKQRFGS